MPDETIPCAFHFAVNIGQATSTDTSFQEVSGMTAEMQTDEVREGGENRFLHMLPKGVKHPQLELKRAIAALDSALVTWCKSVLESGMSVGIKPQLVVVKLLDETAQPLRSWSFADAYPVKWEVEGFNASKNELAIEKIVLNYSYSTRDM